MTRGPAADRGTYRPPMGRASVGRPRTTGGPVPRSGQRGPYGPGRPVRNRRSAGRPETPRWLVIVAAVAGLAAVGTASAFIAASLAADPAPPPSAEGTGQPVDPTTPPTPDATETSGTIATAPPPQNGPGPVTEPQTGLPRPPSVDGLSFGGAIGLGIDGRDIDGDTTLDVWYIGGELRANTAQGAYVSFDPQSTPSGFRDDCEAHSTSEMRSRLSLGGIEAGELVCARTSRGDNAAVFVARKDGSTVWINVATW